MLDWNERVRIDDNTAKKRMIKAGIPPRYFEAELTKPFDPEQCYFFYGPTGTGKTQLICALIKNHILSRFCFQESLFIPSEDLIDQLREAQFKRKPDYNKQYEDEDFEDMDRQYSFMDRLKNLPILAVDDLGAGKATDWSDSQIYTLINYRYNHLKVTYFSSNRSIKDLADVFDVRVVDRLLHMCVEVKIGGDSLRV